MTEHEHCDDRAEVYLSKRTIDTASGHTIHEKVVALKSKAETIEQLLTKAKEALDR